jgi:hypothetical protein
MSWSVAGENKTKEFIYDKNGNLTKDYNKRIIEISYNVLNLSQALKISSATNTYTYAADGRKLKTVLGGSKTTD